METQKYLETILTEVLHEFFHKQMKVMLTEEEKKKIKESVMEKLSHKYLGEKHNLAHKRIQGTDIQLRMDITKEVTSIIHSHEYNRKK